ncbi:AEC family transporter [Amphritea sp. 2_MG-2023]|jgi:predicted permease|uniref:AEC family transporter n=1 Tax=Amphritea TaxID=515417 RepID=UPI001C06B9B4|nr:MULTISPECIES: AEC family transporter [Amphritea]MBU2966039.1 AEC family transporter [Amphritea atlantica]MDO6418129.1 AEC family transporter [Amphritea sp. 2_MG-2023]MDX2422126.1 AEC family transporter [Amphritea sp.]
MLTMIGITAPIFLLILVGYIVSRVGIIPRESLPGMSSFVLYLALPVLIFHKLTQMDLGTIVDSQYLLVYAVAGVLSFFTVFFISRMGRRDSLSFAGLKGMGSAMPNSVFIGFPVALQYFDQPPTQALVMCLLVENIVLFPLALAFMEAREDQGADLKKLTATVALRLMKNPIIIAVISGILVSLIGLQLPQFLDRAMQILNGSAAPMALIIIGASLAGTKVTASLKEVSLIAFGKLLLQPIIALLLVIFVVPDMDNTLKQAVVIFSASPMLSVYPIFGSKYGHQVFCSGVLLITTALSFLSVTLILSLLSLIA